MTPSRKCYQFSLRVTAVVSHSAIFMLLLSIIVLLSSQSGSTVVGLTTSASSYKSDDESVQQGEMVLGSRPPGCVNKCMNCQPCRATLVIPPHQNRASAKPAHTEDDSYYLLSWKCSCGDKLFQP